jgi:hypothetical protein
MSKVNKLLAKALSTSSEEEALSALRLARKSYTGGEVNLEAGANAESDYWRETARSLHASAKRWKDVAEYYRREYNSAYTRFWAQKNDAAVAKAEARSAKRNVEKKNRLIIYLIIATASSWMFLAHQILGG